MKDKYYTPEIEEFHVGFEYEVNYGKDKWVKEGLHYAPQVVTLPYKNLENIRVKHLDREDIEECGAEFQFIESLDCLPPIVSEHFQLGEITIIFKDNNICIHKNYGVLFQGTIKNKSELKRLLKQLGI
jgi:hypothetical protein